MSAVVGVVSAVFWGVVLFSVLVFVHEGGHFLAARAFGMRVTEFFLGMPSRFKLSYKSKNRGTEIGVTPVLLGGYTRICGMEGVADEVAERTLGEIAAAGRIDISELIERVGAPEKDVMDALTLLVDWASVEPYFDLELGERPGQSDWPRSVQTTKRDARLLTAFDSGHDFAAAGTTEAGAPHALPEGGAAQLLAEERRRTYQGKGFLARVITLVAGPAVNLVLGIVLLAANLSIGGVSYAVNIPEVGDVVAGGLAEKAGIVAGDTIVSVAGTEVSTWTAITDPLTQALEAGEPFELVFEHEGLEVTATIEPDGGSHLGIGPTYKVYHPSFASSLSTSVGYLKMTASYVLKLVQPAHTAEVVSQSSSLVGISVMASEAASEGPSTFINLLAAISLSLGLMNLLPIPPLDGGKLLIELIQLVIRRRVPEKAQTAISYIGLGLMLLLFVFVLGQDIIRYVLGG